MAALANILVTITAYAVLAFMIGNTWLTWLEWFDKHEKGGSAVRDGGGAVIILVCVAAVGWVG